MSQSRQRLLPAAYSAFPDTWSSIATRCQLRCVLMPLGRVSRWYVIIYWLCSETIIRIHPRCLRRVFSYYMVFTTDGRRRGSVDLNVSV